MWYALFRIAAACSALNPYLPPHPERISVLNASSPAQNMFVVVTTQSPIPFMSVSSLGILEQLFIFEVHVFLPVKLI